ncbi:MAG: hypothetical protein JKY30_10125 [Flavobacteriales bacterium]|nr:hypothetical protein [Flavobacteriales bacterium]
MNYRLELEQGQSKILTTAIVNEVANSQVKMDELMQCFVDGPIRITQRAAWPMSDIAKKHPLLLFKYYPLLIDLLNQSDKHDAINRNILRAFQFVEIPEEYEGHILNVSFKLLNSNTEPVAVKAFSMTVIYNLTKKYPDIIPELKASIKALIPDGSPGIKNRGNKILNAIK